MKRGKPRLQDTAWANERLAELQGEREKLQREIRARKLQVQNHNSKPPKVTVDEAMAMRCNVETLFEHGTLEEKKKLLRIWIEGIRLTPERLEIEVTYRVPGFVMNKLVAGALYQLNHKMLETLAKYLVYRVALPRKGRHTRPWRLAEAPRVVPWRAVGAQERRSWRPPPPALVANGNGLQERIPEAVGVRGKVS